jgi:hypothetical protein
MTSKRIGRVPCRRSLSTSGKLNPAALAGFFPAAPGRLLRPDCRCRSSHPRHGGRLLCDALEFRVCFPKRTFRCLLAFDKDPDFAPCLPVIAPPDGRTQIEKCPTMRSGARWVIGCRTRLADLTPDPAREPRNVARASAASPPTQHEGTTFVSCASPSPHPIGQPRRRRRPRVGTCSTHRHCLRA